MRSKLPRLAIVVFALVLLSTLSSCDVGGPLLERFTPTGTYSLSWEALPTVEGADDLRLGGFTGLWYLGGREFYTITDRGPVLSGQAGADFVRHAVVPDFTPEIVKLALQDDGSIKIAERLPLTTPTGVRASGMPPPAPWGGGETFTNPDTGHEWGLNPGGLAFHRENNFFWFADHYGPGIYQASAHGQVVRRLRATQGLRRAYVTRPAEGGLTGIDVEPSGQIVAVMSRALENRLSVDDAINDSLRRVVRLNPNTGEERSLFYFVAPESFDGIPASQVELGGLAVVRNNEYLVTEYADVDGRSRSLLFAVTVTDTSTQARPGLEGILGKTIETLTETEWTESGLFPVAKELVADLSKAGITRPQGLAIVDRRRVAILEGNGYGIEAGDPVSGNYQVRPRDVRLVVIELENELDLQ